jgi:hypothetical protein
MPAMVVGCLSPDFEYFFRLAPQGDFGHTWLGILAADLPLSLLVLFVYQSCFKAGLYAIAPGLFPFREEERKPKPVARGLGQWAIVVASILLGVATHIAWDAFTHKDLWLYAHVAFLRVVVPIPLWHAEMCDVLQVASSVAGVAVLLVLWGRWMEAERQPGVPAVRRLGVVFVFLALLAAILRAEVMVHLYGRLILTIIGVVTFLTALILLVGLTGAWQKWMSE